MAEMNAVSRWFVNHLKSRANARLYAWVHGHVALPPASVCLEVGCGNGNMAVRIMDGMGPSRLVATDLDLVQMEAADRFARAHYPSGVPSGLEFRPADMTRLPFPNEGFDAVFAFATLHHAGTSHRDASHLEEALGEIERVTRPAGLLVYEEFLHKARIRSWLDGHGYSILEERRGFRRELVVARKPAPSDAASRAS